MLYLPSLTNLKDANDFARLIWRLSGLPDDTGGSMDINLELFPDIDMNTLTDFWAE